MKKRLRKRKHVGEFRENYAEFVFRFAKADLSIEEYCAFWSPVVDLVRTNNLANVGFWAGSPLIGDDGKRTGHGYDVVFGMLGRPGFSLVLRTVLLTIADETDGIVAFAASDEDNAWDGGTKDLTFDWVAIERKTESGAI